MAKHALWLVVVVVATARAEDGDRSRVDAKLVTALVDFKDCGKRPRGVYDWRAYDAIDWRAAGKDKRETLASERGSVDGLGRGLNALCADPDGRALLATIDTIVYVPSGDRSMKLVASVAGSTLTFRNYIFGSTRDPGDYEAAVKRAFAPKPPPVVVPKAKPAKATAKPAPRAKQKAAPKPSTPAPSTASKPIEKRPDDSVERALRERKCQLGCDDGVSECTDDRCEVTYFRCRDRCDPLPSGSDERKQCFDECSSTSKTCRAACDDAGRACRRACAN